MSMVKTNKKKKITEIHFMFITYTAHRSNGLYNKLIDNCIQKSEKTKSCLNNVIYSDLNISLFLVNIAFLSLH